MIKHLFATPSNPVRLFKEGEAPIDQLAGQATSPTAQAALDVATNWWIMVPVILVGIAAILTIQLRITRARRLPVEERAFRALAQAARVPKRHRILAQRLARTKGSPSPVALLLSDTALALASARIETKPGSSTDRVLTEYLASRRVRDPRAASAPTERAGSTLDASA